MFLSAVNLNYLMASKSWKLLRLIRMRSSNWKYSCILNQTQSRIVITCNLSDSIIAEWALKLEFRYSCCWWIFANFAMEFASSEVQCSMRRYAYCMIAWTGNLSGWHLLKSCRACWYQGILLRNSKRKLAILVPTEAPLECSILTNLPSNKIWLFIFSIHSGKHWIPRKQVACANIIRVCHWCDCRARLGLGVRLNGCMRRSWVALASVEVDSTWDRWWQWLSFTRAWQCPGFSIGNLSLGNFHHLLILMHSLHVIHLTIWHLIALVYVHAVCIHTSRLVRLVRCYACSMIFIEAWQWIVALVSILHVVSDHWVGYRLTVVHRFEMKSYISKFELFLNFLTQL